MSDVIDLRNSESKYWNDFYKESQDSKHFTTASPFAEFCAEKFIKIGKQLKILDIGCGNGRDSIAFSSLGYEVLGIDRSEQVTQNYVNIKNLNFMQLDISQIKQLNFDFDVIYARFFLHSITESSENDLLTNLFKLCKEGTTFFFEFRTDKDPLMKEGTQISFNERMTSHYRRFINFDSFSKKIQKIGFCINYSTESENLAKFGNENPVVARFILTKV